MKFTVTYTASFEGDEIECHNETEARELATQQFMDIEFEHDLELLTVDVEEEDYDLTDKQVIAMFEAEILPGIVARYGRDDSVALREAFSAFTDALCKNNQITTWQYDNIDDPY